MIRKFFKKLEEKFGRNKKALTFALPIEKRGNGKPQNTTDFVILSEARKGQKIFESWETIALYSDSHRNKTNS